MPFPLYDIFSHLQLGHCSGFSTPSLDSHSHENLNLQRNTHTNPAFHTLINTPILSIHINNKKVHCYKIQEIDKNQDFFSW